MKIIEEQDGRKGSERTVGKLWRNRNRGNRNRM